MTAKNIIGAAILSLAVVLGGCATAELTGPKDPYNVKEESEISPDRSRVVVYRGSKEKKLPSPIARVEGQVLGALSPGQYLQSDICPNTANQIKLYNSQNDYEPVSFQVTAQPGEVRYVRVSETAKNHFKLTAVDSEVAQKEMKKAKHSSYLINRMQVDCDVEPAPILIKEVAIGADALFGFDSADISQLMGKQRLLELIEEINELNIHVETIRVVGHTDRLGREQYNLNLSERRAKTVAHFLRTNGVTNKLEVFGMGSSEPVSENCEGERATPELIECLQPDRRVTIELWGTQVLIQQDAEQ